MPYFVTSNKFSIWYMCTEQTQKFSITDLQIEKHNFKFRNRYFNLLDGRYLLYSTFLNSVDIWDY